MKPLRRLAFALVAALTLASAGVVGEREAARATPFADVPANHWAYQYIQTLAADGLIDGYTDGAFKGDRPLTRYEMAVIVARVIAKLQENAGARPSREDLDKLQKLTDALKDELDS
ncbi:MAG: S-layer homology domain-containing protein, partial [Candidatus Eremiobacteraeota bacterium]|nr:S-layer homology domain-containing protein [Candidatus Eremiobacteraeota bacterium]